MKQKRQRLGTEISLMVLSTVIASGFFFSTHWLQSLQGQLRGGAGPSNNNFLNRSVRASHFDWIGYLPRNPARRFTDQEIDTLAVKNTFVIIPKFHAGYNKEEQHKDARALKQRLPNTKVLFYISGRYVFILEQPLFAELGFQEDWYLRAEVGEHAGQKVPQDLQSWDTPDNRKALFMDMSHPDLRAWLISYMRDHHFAVAPYDGIAFDSARKIGEGNNAVVWSTILLPEKVAAWNEGLLQMLRDTRAAFPDAFLMFNGMTKVAQTPDRSVDQIGILDGALFEQFCLEPGNSSDTRIYMTPNRVAEELDLIESYGRTEKTLFVRVDYSESKHSDSLGKNFVDMSRYCFGMFTLVNRSGRSYFKIGGYDLTPESLQYPKEADIRLGAPLGTVLRTSGLFSREFQNGFVIVNTDEQRGTVILPSSSPTWVRIRGNAPSETLNAGTAVSIDPRDAIFFLRSLGGPVE